MPQLTNKVLSYLATQPTDTILDLGCGDGQLTAEIATQAQSVLGLDSSASMIASARKTYSHNLPNCRFEVADCRHLDRVSLVEANRFDKIFSNAALHWILRDEATRADVFSSVHAALKPQGLFVFEMGGQGNVADVHTALRAALMYRGGLSMHVIRQACPWFFPSEEGMRSLLTTAGLEVVTLESEWRPTRLTEDRDGGLHGWVRLFGARFLELLDGGEERERAVREVCEILEDVLKRDEDGSLWLGYVRLRGVARKV